MKTYQVSCKSFTCKFKTDKWNIVIYAAPQIIAFIGYPRSHLIEFMLEEYNVVDIVRLNEIDNENPSS